MSILRTCTNRGLAKLAGRPLATPPGSMFIGVLAALEGRRIRSLLLIHADECEGFPGESVGITAWEQCPMDH